MNDPTLVVAFVEYSSVVEVENHHHLEKVIKDPSLEVVVIMAPRSSLILMLIHS